MLFEEIVYGPIHSRRLGTSLGINLMPTDCKLCTFDCVYCECGWTKAVRNPALPTRKQVSEALKAKLSVMSLPIDVITFSGNGEPTLHPEFEGIMQDTCHLRDRYCEDAKVSVLSNSTQLYRPEVVRGLLMADNRILKLDSAIDRTMRLIDRPLNTDLTVEKIVSYMEIFYHDFSLQTCFLRGECEGETIDNTTNEELRRYYEMVDRLVPKDIMIYVIDRQTPCPTLEKIGVEKMQEIADMLRHKGFSVTVSL